ncbi:bola protein [Podospora conica]|nr:bola protein [Schizothecium conicum]
MICRVCLRARAGALRAGASRPLSTMRQTPPALAQPLSSIAALLPRPTSHLPQTAVTSPRSFSASATAPAPAPLVKPADLTEGESQVWDKVVAELAPVELQVQDVSGGCGSMYAIDVSSEQFRGLNMLKQQRLVNTVLADMVKQWHGVQLRTRVPE